MILAKILIIAALACVALGLKCKLKSCFTGNPQVCAEAGGQCIYSRRCASDKVIANIKCGIYKKCCRTTPVNNGPVGNPYVLPPNPIQQGQRVNSYPRPVPPDQMPPKPERNNNGFLGRFGFRRQGSRNVKRGRKY